MKNFSISVYFFHLNQTLSESWDRVSPKADLIWENLIKLSEKLPFSEIINLKSKLVCYELDEESQVLKHKTTALNLINELLTEDQEQIEFAAINHNGLAISGNLQPFLLNDTYAFDLSLFPENSDQDITPEELYLFEPSSLFLEFSENTLGETIWFYGETEVADAECQAVADKLVTNFLKDTKFTPRLVDRGSLLKLPLFEYEISQGNQSNKLYRILVWINNQAISLDFPTVYNALLGSLWTRHKIEYAYQEGRESYNRARNAYSDIEAKIKEFKQDKPLEELQKLLESMPELSMQYQRQLRNLQGHYTTIKTNQINHRNYLNKIGQASDISSWLKFDEITCKRYLDQIETDLSYIQPGKDLIGEFINTLRGLVEIEQAKSDRNLQNTIQAVGTGIGVGVGFAGILAAGYPLIEKPWDFPSPQHPLLPPHPFIIAVVLSCLSGGGLGWLAWFSTKRYLNRKSSDQQTSVPSPQNQLPSGDV
jgi:hypothetical protein